MQSDYNYVEINGGKGWDTKKGQRKAIGIQKCSQEEKEREKDGGGGEGAGPDRRGHGQCLAVVLMVLRCVQLSATPWTVARQASLSMGFPREEYWNGLPWPPPGDLPDPGIEPASLSFPALQADSLPLSHPGRPFTGVMLTHHCV